MKKRIGESCEEYKARNREYMAGYRKKNGPYQLSEEQKQAARQQRKKYYAENKTAVLEKRKDYYRANKLRDNAKNKEYRRINFSSLRERELIRKYDLDAEGYKKLHDSQNGVCAVCFSDNNGKNMDVDHCHDTNQIRGLLCRSCNLLIGHAKNDPEILTLAAYYLSP